MIFQIALTLSFLNAARAGDLKGKVQSTHTVTTVKSIQKQRNMIESFKVTARNDFIIPCPIDQLPCSGND